MQGITVIASKTNGKSAAVIVLSCQEITACWFFKSKESALLWIQACFYIHVSYQTFQILCVGQRETEDSATIQVTIVTSC